MAGEAGRVGVLMGGISNEREVSLRSGKTALEALLGENIDAVGIDVDTGDAGEIELMLKSRGIKAAFIALHGRLGEDGRIQGILEAAGIPYTGSGAAASAVCFNKLLANNVLESFGIPVPRYVFASAKNSNGPPSLSFGFPAVVKPASGGSAIGVTIARRPGGLESAMETAFAEDSNILIEEYIEGRELTVSVLGGRNIRVLPVIEIKTGQEFYNFTAKYVKGESRHILPAPLEEPERERVEDAAGRAYRFLGCRGFARIDILLCEKGVPYVIDVNTIPGLTPTSLFPESAAAAGITAGELCRYLLRAALESEEAF